LNSAKFRQGFWKLLMVERSVGVGEVLRRYKCDSVTFPQPIGFPEMRTKMPFVSTENVFLLPADVRQVNWFGVSSDKDSLGIPIPW
jgi:hypothetical protein